MADVTVDEFLHALSTLIEARRPKQNHPHASLAEVAAGLARPEHEVQPALEAAVEGGLVVEHQEYRGNYELTAAGVARLDAPLFGGAGDGTT